MKNRYFHFGLPSLLDVVPDALENNTIRETVEMHKDALVSFIVPKEHHDHQVRLLGSGFFIYSSDPTCAIIMTARHVLEDFSELGFGYITIGTQMIPIGDIGTRFLDPNLDLASWVIPSNYLLDYISQPLATLPLFDPRLMEESFHPTCSFALIGYPGSKNKSLDMRKTDKRDRALFGLGLHGYAFDKETKEFRFHYSGKGIPEDWSKQMTTPPNLEGMSGSPCLRFVIAKDKGARDKRPLMAVVAGVFTRKHGPHEIRAIALNDAWLNSIEHNPSTQNCAQAL